VKKKALTDLGGIERGQTEGVQVHTRCPYLSDLEVVGDCGYRELQE
jgi:hypothetical protein